MEAENQREAAAATAAAAAAAAAATATTAGKQVIMVVMAASAISRCWDPVRIPCLTSVNCYEHLLHARRAHPSRVKSRLL